MDNYMNYLRIEIKKLTPDSNKLMLFINDKEYYTCNEGDIFMFVNGELEYNPAVIAVKTTDELEKSAKDFIDKINDTIRNLV